MTIVIASCRRLLRHCRFCLLAPLLLLMLLPLLLWLLLYFMLQLLLLRLVFCCRRTLSLALGLGHEQDC